MLELFMRAEPDTKWASRPRTILELAAVRACHPEKEEDAAVAERLERVEKLIESGAALSARPQPRPAEKREEKPPEKAGSKAGPKPRPAAAKEPPREYLDALERLKAENPSIRTPLSSMRFVSFDGRQVAVEFEKKGFMHLKLLERKKPLIEEALTGAFGEPVAISMTLEGSGAPEKKMSDAARDVINQAYDVFGREKTSIEE